MRSRRLAAGVAVAIVCCGAAARAQSVDRKTDVIVLTNGDRFTGEIKSLEKGRLSFDMSSTGVVSIKWDRVAELTTQYVYEIETATGGRLLGTLAPAGTGMLAVTTEAGARRTIAIASIVGLAPIVQSFLSRLNGSVDLGGSYTQSGGVAQLWINYSMTARRPAFEWRIEFEDYLTIKTDDGNSEQLAGSLSYARYVSAHWAVFGLAQVERNPDLGFDFRGTATGGVEWTLQRSNRSEIVAGAGLGGSQERPVDAETELQLPALLGIRQSLFIYDSPKTTLDTSFMAYPILNQWGRWRLKGNASIKREIFKDFSIGLTFYESFDSAPSGAEARRNDVGTTLSIGYIF